MRLRDTMKRMARIAAVVAAALAIALPAQAKWSKASTKFTYDGVSVDVTDRSRWVGTMQDTYGYATYENRNDEIVTVNWRSYGVLKHGSKLVCLDDESFVLYPKQTRREVYSYSGGHYTHRDFDKFVIAIEVVKGAPLPPEPELPPVRDDEVVNADNADEVYERICQHINGTITQQDYTDALSWMEYTLIAKMAPLWRGMDEAIQRGENPYQVLLIDPEVTTRWRTMAFFVTSASVDGLLSEENEKRYQKLSDDIAEYGH